MCHHVLVTRTPHDCRELDALLEGSGVRTRPFPVLRVEEHTDRSGWRRVSRHLPELLHEGAWLLLTSPRAPRFFVEQVTERKTAPLLTLETASVGPTTTCAAERAGLSVTLEGGGDAASLADALVERWQHPTTAILAGGVHLRAELPRGLEQAGHTVLKLKVYAMRATPPRELPPIGPSHAVVVTSPRAAQYYIEAVGGLPLPVPHWALGPTTRDAAAALGITCAIPEEPTMESLSESLKQGLG